MKKFSKFYLSKQKKLKDLVKQMEDLAIEDERKKLKKIVSQRKQKWKDSTVVTQLRLPNFNHLRKQYMQFSTIQPNASKQPFVTQKQKIKVNTSNRAYSSTPNLKAGAFQTTSNSQNDILHPTIISRMFLEYHRLIDQQTPGVKIKALKQLEKSIHLPKSTQKNNNHQTLDKTYFQKFSTYRFNIDKTSDYHSITELMTRKCITDRANERQCEQSLIEQKSIKKYMKTRSPSVNSRLFELKKVKRMHSTLDSTGNDDSESFDCSVLDRSFKPQKMGIEQESKGSKKSIYSKSRMRNSKVKESRVKFAKNMNSVEF